MPVSDDEIRQALRRIADRVPDDPESALRSVERRAAASTSRSWVLGALGAAAAVVALVLLVTALGTDRLAGERPAAPASTPSPVAPSNLFKVIRALEPPSLGLEHVLRVAVSPRGYLVVTDRSQRVAEVTTTGRVLRTWGSSGTGQRRFRLGSGAVAVDGRGRVYVADTYNSRIQVFDADGRFVRSLGGFGHGPGRFVQPTEVAVDGNGDVYVNDDQQRTLTKLSSTGRELWRLGGTTTSDPDLRGHWHFTGFDRNGDLVAANDDAGKVLWLTPDGTKVKAFGSGASSFRSGGASRAVGEFPHGACGATTDPTDRLYVSSCQDAGAPRHGVEVFDRHHRLLALSSNTPFAAGPVFLPDGTGVMVTHRGAVVEAQVRAPGG